MKSAQQKRRPADRLLAWKILGLMCQAELDKAVTNVFKGCFQSLTVTSKEEHIFLRCTLFKAP